VQNRWRCAPKLLPSARRKQALAKRDEWLSELDPAFLFHRLFDLIPGLHFFAKNSRGEVMFCSDGILHLYKLQDEIEIVGLTDFDLNPAEMAEAYVQDDAKIYRTGAPILNQVELWFDDDGMPDWFVINKLPMRGRNGEIIGVMGLLQSYTGRASLLPPFGDLSRGVGYMRKNFAEKISIAQVARASSLSQRQLERKFHAAFGVSPQLFLIKTRVLAACHSLRKTDQSLTEIALASGFSDLSAFVHHFRRLIGVTPRAFRRGTTGTPGGKPCAE
jgi:AraC-like DNA-binding protein